VEAMTEMRLCIWGAGWRTYKFLQEVQSDELGIYDDEIVGVVDRDQEKWGKSIVGHRISSPDDVDALPYEKILICSLPQEKSIRADIEKKYRIKLKDVINFKEYQSQKVISYQFAENQKRHTKQKYQGEWQPFDVNHMVVYTAIIGAYDTLKDPTVIDDGVRYVCFTDQPDVKSKVWEIHQIDYDDSISPALLTRKFKLLPHCFFPKTKTSVWADASLQIRGSIKSLLSNYQSTSNLLFFPHQERFCIYDEAAICVLGFVKKMKESIYPQMMKYLSEGFPYNYGLLCGGFMARNHNDAAVKKAMEDWYMEVERFSPRDQLSLPYVLWKHHLDYDLIPYDIYDNPWMKITKHIFCS